ncbi:MAG: cation diffusion facilitator family transporter [Candidatus Kapaibacterium sp.]
METMVALTDRQPLRRKAALISFGVGILMFAMKTGAYFITDSAAILSDAMESVVHVVATCVALYSIMLVGRPADRKHPYGYGKVEYFSAGLEGALIFLAAMAICYAAVDAIIRGNHPKSLDVGAWVVGIAGAINLGLGVYLIRTGRRTNSLVLIADGKHVLTDSYTSIGVLVGVLLVHFTKITILDPIFAIAVGLNIIWTGYQLISESIRGLMNTTDPGTLQKTVEVVNRHRTPDMIDMHRLRSWSAGERRFIDFHLTLPFYLQLQKSHAIQDALHDAISHEFSDQAEVMLHLDPCTFTCCVICGKPDCPVRGEEQRTSHEFTMVTAQGEPAHLLLERDV